MKIENIGFYTLEDIRAKNVSINTPLWRCELLLTNKCNFKCPYCRGTENDANISFEYAKYVIDLWAKDNLRNIRFSGGELTCVKWLPDLIAYTNSKSIKRIAISTNGSRNTEYYIDLCKRGVNDFSISLDACCSSFGDKMSGVKGVWKTVVKNIEVLSKLTYVTTGCVFDKNNVKQSLETVKLAHKLGVSDIRIISSAQYNEVLEFVKDIPKEIINAHPILKYRVDNFKKGKNVRGIKETDYHKCPLMLDDMVVRGNYHYPCVINMREGGRAIGKVGKNMRKERFEYYINHDTYRDPICRKNCLDICVDYNNKVLQLNTDLVEYSIHH